jgi:hypothetical protein
MMSHDEWLSALLEHARTIASREWQEQNWFRKDLHVDVKWVVEVYEGLDDLTFDLFFKMYAEEFSSEQLAAWTEFKRELEKYGETLPQYPDERQVFEDPRWWRVRDAATHFVAAFEQKQVSDE